MGERSRRGEARAQGSWRTWCRSGIPLLAVGFLLVSVSVPLPHAQAAEPPAPPTADDSTDLPPSQGAQAKPAYAQGQFIVKFKPSLTQCAHCLLEDQRLKKQRRPFQMALTDFADSIDALNQRFQVQSASNLFADPEGHERSTAKAKAKRHHRHKKIKDKRGKQAAARPPPDAELPDLTNVYVFTVPPETNIAEAVAAYAADPHVEYAQPNYLVRAYRVPDDPYYHSAGTWGQDYDDLWGLKKIRAAEAWDTTQGERIVVAVVDTGLDYNHPDIAANVWTNSREIPGNGRDDDGNGFIDDIRGWDFTTCARVNDDEQCVLSKTPDNDPIDGDGHGTHVAGTIAAVGNNNLGIIGVAPKAKIMPLKSLGDQGSGVTSEIAQAIEYAVDNDADVINLSLGCDAHCPNDHAMQEAVQLAYANGVVVVLAAGNAGDDVASISPQNMRNFKPIVVASSDHLDQRSDFSNFGVQVDVAAPGGDSGQMAATPSGRHYYNNVLSLRAQNTDMYLGAPNYTPGEFVVDDGAFDYYRSRGTSMAAPHVAGAAALVLAASRRFGRRLTNDDVRQILRATAQDIGSPGFDLYTGAGRLNAEQAVRMPSALRVKIESPASRILLDPHADSVAVTGTATGLDFQQYQLSWGRGPEPTNWTAIGPPGLRPVQDSVLGTWTFLQWLPTGTYLLKLVAATYSGLLFQDVVHVARESSVRPVELDTNRQWIPAISGNRIVWIDYRDPLRSAIYLYDVTTDTERAITDASHGRIQRVSISGDRIVWVELLTTLQPGSLMLIDNWSLYLYDLTTETEPQLITSSRFPIGAPAISGDRIVWMDRRNVGWDIYLYDLRTNTERRITSEGGDQVWPAISGDRIVWEDRRNLLTAGTDIYLYELATSTERRITTDPAFQSRRPAISGDRIVWEDSRNGEGDIYLYDLATNTERQITTGPADQMFPAISGDRVVWQDTRHGWCSVLQPGNCDIYLFDLATSTEQQITADFHDQSRPAISGDRIVWEDRRNDTGQDITSTNWDIYLYDPPTVPPDLVVEAIRVDPPAPVAGSQVTLEATIRNTETTASAAPSRARYRISGPGVNLPDQFYRVDALAGGAGHTASGTFTVGEPGSYSVEVCADADDAVQEADEDNNCQTASVSVRPVYQIEGRVIRSDNILLMGATVRLEQSSTHRLVAQSTTDGSGAYRFPDLADDTYDVIPTAGCYTISPSMQGILLAGSDARVPDFTASFLPTVPTCRLTFSPPSGPAGSYTIAEWGTTDDADGQIPFSCTTGGTSGILPPSGQAQGYATETFACTITVENSSGQRCDCSAAFTVTP